MAATTIEPDKIRKVLPVQFQKRFDSLWRSQRKELAKIMGNPPDPKKVTKAHWDRWEKDQQALLLILMAGYAVPQLNAAVRELTRRGLVTLTDAVTRRLRRALLSSLKERAKFAAGSIRKTTQARIQNRSTPVEDDTLDSVMSEQRSRTIATTEMSASRSVSVLELYLGFRAQGVECELVWRLRPCEHCEICPMLDGTTHDYWSRYFPKGPPVHPNCCCQLEILFGSFRSLLARGRVKHGPPARYMNRALSKHRR